MSNKTQVLCNFNSTKITEIKSYWKIIHEYELELMKIEQEFQQIISSSKDQENIQWEQPKDLTNVQWVQLANLTVRNNHINDRIKLYFSWINQVKSELIIC